MKLISANIGRPQTQINGNRLETTGIYKEPISHAVSITAGGIEQDFIGDPKNHGGPDQAVYVYGTKDYEWWSHELGREMGPGTFGENLTISDLESASMHIGDRLRVGKVLLQVSAPRIPCSTLAARMGDPGFAKRYRSAERPGVYCRVIEVEELRAGQVVEHIPYMGEPVSVLDVFREHFARAKEATGLQRMLRAPVAMRVRAALEDDLRRLLRDDPT